jgi:hypothetical protein
MPVNLNDPETIIDQDIFALIGLDKLSSDKKNKMMDDMMRTVENRIIARILDVLDKDEEEQFEKAIDEGGDAVKNFLKRKGLDLVNVSAQEAIAYKAEMMAVFNGAPSMALA